MTRPKRKWSGIRAQARADHAPPPQLSILMAEDGLGVAVMILPSPKEVGQDPVFPGYLGARAYAQLLWMKFSWRIADRCDNKMKLAALKHG